MSTQKIYIALRSGLFLAVPAIIAWLVGEPFIFPSLGPTAYVLAFRSESKYTAKTVIGGHVCGVAGGLLSYHLMVAPNSLNMMGGVMQESGFLLGAGAVLALVITVLLMLIFEASHPPACATTLIVSLGILSGWVQAAFIMIAVAAIYLTYRLYQALISPS